MRRTANLLVIAAAAAAAVFESAVAQPLDAEDGHRATDLPVYGELRDDGTDYDALEPASPDQIERAVYQRIAEQSGLELTSLTSVDCDGSRCTIVFSGPETTPLYVDGYTGLLRALMKPPWNNYRVTQGSLGHREVSPGTKEYVLKFTYVALVDASDDPQRAARQHAACAGAWARVTELRGSNEYIRMAHERAAENLEIAARTLGLEQARRVAKERRLGPLARECHALPY